MDSSVAISPVLILFRLQYLKGGAISENKIVIRWGNKAHLNTIDSLGNPGYLSLRVERLVPLPEAGKMYLCSFSYESCCVADQWLLGGYVGSGGLL